MSWPYPGWNLSNEVCDGVWPGIASIVIVPPEPDLRFTIPSKVTGWKYGTTLSVTVTRGCCVYIISVEFCFSGVTLILRVHNKFG